MSRRILIVVNPHRPETLAAGDVATRVLADAGIGTCTDVAATDETPIEAALVLGGDGTMLHAAALTQGLNIPLLGVNLGRVGFLAELERDDVAEAARRLIGGDYTVERRGTLGVTVTRPDGTRHYDWALNEATLERSAPVNTLELAVEVDGRPLSTFACDGVVVSTATGSTAHAFSAGGPVMWPDVDALLFVPLSAHALFARPLVVGPRSFFAMEVVESSAADGLVVLDGRRTIEAPVGSRVEVRRGAEQVVLARITEAPFTERLVEKFSLPTNGWRGERVARMDVPLQPDEDGSP